MNCTHVFYKFNYLDNVLLSAHRVGGGGGSLGLEANSVEGPQKKLWPTNTPVLITDRASTDILTDRKGLVQVCVCVCVCVCVGGGGGGSGLGCRKIIFGHILNMLSSI